MNRLFTTLSLSSLATASLWLAGCSEPPVPPAAVRPVFVTTVQPAPSTQTRSFSSTVRARVESDLAFRTGGKVVERLVEIGDAVKTGQVLARLDPADYQLAVQAAADQVQAATVDAQQAASDEARFGRLLADGSVGAADHERQKARADAAAARLAQARRQLELARNREGYAALVAPYAGVVTAIRFERGQVVPEGQPVLSLARDGDREVVVDLPEDWVDRARQLQATAAPWAEPQARLPVALRELSPQASTPGRTFRARFAATQDARAQLSALPLGSTVQLTLSAPQSGPATVALPVSALLKGSGPEGVWTLNAQGSGLVFTPVKVLAIDDATVRVSGLAQGSRVVTVGAQKLDAGTVVRAIERASETTATTMAKSSS